MQRFALTEEGKRVSAEEALSQVNYVCPECLSLVRLKKGEVKVAHFFHLEEGRECRWKTRFQVHTSIQENIAQRLGNCTVECFFPEISRIADIAYHPSKVVFEIQVSPISAQEVRIRTEDYFRAGWHVIWILHAEQFGKQKACEAEEVFQGIPHYFTSFFDRGDREELCVWDDSSFVYKRKRRWFKPISRIKILNFDPCIFFTPPSQVDKRERYFKSFKEWYEFRKKTWSCSLPHDLLSEISEKDLRIKHPLFSLKNNVGRASIFLRLRTFFFLVWLKLLGAK